VSRRRSLRTLAGAVSERFPDLPDPVVVIVRGGIAVNGLVVTNPNTLVRHDARIALTETRRLRGEAKLGAALDAFQVDVAGRVALDLGAAAGGFTRVLLDRGAVRVYAVDAGHGQLLGSLRRDPRVVNLERTNISALDRRLVPEAAGLISMDLSYLALAAALPQLRDVELHQHADLIALVKPMFELRRDRPPDDPAEWERAVELASAGARRCGWRVEGAIRSPVTGAGGAVEFLLHCSMR
jgi:23S rRNA (cytidine1920-2'-O)/16S rRNA (cytidine1409-2'-O)-methyltransferase